jgi:hypothetical protein
LKLLSPSFLSGLSSLERGKGLSKYKMSTIVNELIALRA